MEGSSNSLPDLDSVISNYNAIISDIREEENVRKKNIFEAVLRLQFARDIFLHFSEIFEDLDLSPLVHLKTTIHKVRGEVSIYATSLEVFEKFKKSFTKKIKKRHDKREIRQFAEEKFYKKFMERYSRPDEYAKSYQSLYSDFINLLLDDTSNPKKLKIDCLCNPSSLDPTYESIQSYFSESRENKEKEKEKEKENDGRDFGFLGFLNESFLQTTSRNYTAPNKLVEMEPYKPELRFFTKTIMKNGEILISTKESNVIYWNSNHVENPFSFLVTPFPDAKNLLMDSNPQYSAFVYNNSQIKILGASPIGSYVNQIGRIPTRYSFSFFSPNISTMRLYKNIIALGFNNGRLKVFGLNDDHQTTTPLLEIRSKLECQGFSTKALKVGERLSHCDKESMDPFGNLRIQSMDLSEELIVAGGSHKTIFLSRLDRKVAPVVIRGFLAMVKIAKFGENFFLTGIRHGTVTLWDLRTQSKIEERYLKDEVLDICPDSCDKGYYALVETKNEVVYYDVRSSSSEPSWRYSKQGYRLTTIAKDEDNLIVTGSGPLNGIIIRLNGSDAMIS